MEARLDLGAPVEPEAPVTAAYEAFLSLLAPKLDLRVVIDVISGASAGGVNGVMLARALAHNLSLEAHRDLWLENADVTRLANEPVGLTRYLKGSIAPVLDRLVTMALKSETDDGETRSKLRRLMQSRWFTPPPPDDRRRSSKSLVAVGRLSARPQATSGSMSQTMASIVAGLEVRTEDDEAGGRQPARAAPSVGSSL